jgi:phage baseplate assembly protein W
VATVPLTGSERAHPIRNNYGDNLRDLADDPIRDAMMAS